MKKIKWYYIFPLVLVVLLVVFVLNIVFSLNGNPVTKAVASSRIREYVRENYPDMNLEVSKTGYNFKFGEYLSHIQSKDSTDTSFTVYWKDGNIEDTYEEDVINRWKTYERLQREFSKALEEIIAREFPYETSIVFGDLGNKGEDRSGLELDMSLDMKKLPAPATLTIYFYSREVSYELFEERLLEISGIMERHDISISYYNLVMEEPMEEGEKAKPDGQRIYLYDYPVQRLASENLVEDIKVHIAQWEKEHEK